MASGSSFDLDSENYLRTGLIELFIGVFLLGTPLVVGGMPEDNFDYLLGSLVGGMVGLGALWVGLTSFKMLQVMKSFPTSKIRSMAMGDVHIKGDVEPLEKKLKSPFTEEEVVYYEYRIEERKSSRKDRVRNWETIEKGNESVRFILNDGTDRAVVDPDNASFEVTDHYSEKFSSINDLPEKAQNLVRSGRINLGPLRMNNNRMRIIEKVVTFEDKVNVFGYADRYEDPNSANKVVREGGSPVYVISNKSEEQLKSKISRDWKLGLGVALVVIPVTFYYLMTLTGAW